MKLLILLAVASLPCGSEIDRNINERVPNRYIARVTNPFQQDFCRKCRPAQSTSLSAHQVMPGAMAPEDKSLATALAELLS